jgi:hypothetical protein
MVYWYNPKLNGGTGGYVDHQGNPVNIDEIMDFINGFSNRGKDRYGDDFGFGYNGYFGYGGSGGYGPGCGGHGRTYARGYGIASGSGQLWLYTATYYDSSDGGRTWRCTFERSWVEWEPEKKGDRARYFSNVNDGYKYMWDNSFENGIPKREVSGWLLRDGGIIVLPFSGNKVGDSYNDALPRSKEYANGRFVKFEGKWRPIKTHAHTHPSKDPSNGIGLVNDEDTGDAKMFNFVRNSLIILYNGNIYSADFSNYRGCWYWSKLGTLK